MGNERRTIVLSLNFRHKHKKEKKKNSYNFPYETRGMWRRYGGRRGGRETNQSTPTALLPSRNTSIAPRYILPNARTNIHPALVIIVRSSVPLLLLFLLLNVYQNQRCLIHCCKAGNSCLNSRYHLT